VTSDTALPPRRVADSANDMAELVLPHHWHISQGEGAAAL